MGQLQEGGRAEWVARAASRAGGASALLAAAVSSDGRYLAVGGGDRKVHVWDARSRQYIQARHRRALPAQLPEKRARGRTDVVWGKGTCYWW